MAAAEDIYLFAHAAYRDVAYALQLPSERGRLHALALRIMEVVYAGELDQVSLELAAHARIAREHLPPEQADDLAQAEAGHIMRALERASAKAQLDASISLADLALKCPAITPDQRITALNCKAGALRDTGRGAEAVAVWEQAAEDGRRNDNHKAVVTALTHTASIVMLRGERERGAAMLDEAESLCNRHPMPELHARLLIERAVIGLPGADPEALLQKAADLIRGVPTTNVHLAVQGSLANMYGQDGRRPQAIKILRNLIKECVNVEDPRFLSVAWANLGRQLLLDGRLEEAEHSLKQAAALTAEMGNGRTRAFSMASLAEVQMRQGRVDEAVTSIGTALEIIRDFEAPMYLAAYMCTLANLYLLQGLSRDAAEAVEEARFAFENSRTGMYVPEYCGIVRLRLAADSACAGRETPLAKWLPVMRAELETIKAAHAERGSPGNLLDNVYQSARAVVAEVDAAVAEPRPPQVFRGHLISELTPALRLELRGRITEAEAAWMRRCNTDLWNALHA